MRGFLLDLVRLLHFYVLTQSEKKWEGEIGKRFHYHQPHHHHHRRRRYGGIDKGRRRSSR